MPIRPSNDARFETSPANPVRTAQPDAAFALQLAQFQSETVNSLIRSALGDQRKQPDSPLLALGSNTLAATNSSSAAPLDAQGRNPSLFDPESAYKMMSLINRKDVAYQAEFAALSELGQQMQTVEAESADLSQLSSASSNQQVSAELQQFVDEYNQWVQQFEADLRPGGALAASEAAKVTRYELDQQLKNPFIGAQYGIRGMADLGLRIDPQTRLASLDLPTLNQALDSQRDGAIDAIQSFGRGFVHTATLLNADDNFIRNRLGNLQRALDFISSNKASLQAEFGLGDAATVSPRMQNALTRYQAIQKQKD